MFGWCLPRKEHLPPTRGKDARIAWENQKLIVRNENALRQARRYEGAQPSASPR